MNYELLFLEQRTKNKEQGTKSKEQRQFLFTIILSLRANSPPLEGAGGGFNRLNFKQISR